MLDLHSHILPGIDDGAKTLDESIKMIEMAEKDGTKAIVATPHYCRGYGEEKYEGVKKRVEALREEIKKRNLNIKIHYGQEVYYSENLLDDFENGAIGTINGSDYLLLELNMKESQERVLDDIYELKLQGITTIIAHPERYSYFQNHLRMVNRFIDEGCLFQLNIGSILGKHGEKAKIAAEELLKNNVYSFIGSDAHNMEKRTTKIKDGIEKIRRLNNIFIENVSENSKKLLKNEKIEFLGERFQQKKKKRFIIF
ncbi:MAG: tyrosine-protein phosphatase [Clostridium sp.]